jgi:hypothetical protein
MEGAGYNRADMHGQLKMGGMGGGFGMAERHSALLAALGNIRFDAPDSAEIRRMLDAAITRLDALASRTTGAALR